MSVYLGLLSSKTLKLMTLRHSLGDGWDDQTTLRLTLFHVGKKTLRKTFLNLKLTSRLTAWHGSENQLALINANSITQYCLYFCKNLTHSFCMPGFGKNQSKN